MHIEWSSWASRESLKIDYSHNREILYQKHIDIYVYLPSEDLSLVSHTHNCHVSQWTTTTKLFNASIEKGNKKLLRYKS